MTTERHEVSDALLRSMLLRRAGHPDGALLDDIVRGTRGLEQSRPWWARLLPARSRGAVLGLALIALTATALVMAIAATRPTESPRQAGIVAVGPVVCGLAGVDPNSGLKTTLVPPPSGCNADGSADKGYLLAYRIAEAKTGRILAYGVDRLCGACVSAPSQEQLRAAGIWTVDTTSGTVRRVAECADGFCGEVAVSADGERLAYTTLDPELVVQDIDGSSAIRIPLGAQPLGLRFSADGRRVIVQSEGKVTDYPADGVGDPVTMANSIPGTPMLEFSPDGKYVAASDNDGAIYLSDADLSNPRVIDQVDPGSNAAVAWALDSKSLAYGQSVPASGDAHAVQEQIRVASLDGLVRVAYLSAPIATRYPLITSIAYSPDSQQIAFAIDGYGDKAASGVYIIDVAGGDAHKVDAFEPHSLSVDWITWASRP